LAVWTVASLNEQDACRKPEADLAAALPTPLDQGLNARMVCPRLRGGTRNAVANLRLASEGTLGTKVDSGRPIARLLGRFTGRKVYRHGTIQRDTVIRVDHSIDMIEQELPLRIEIGGALEPRSHRFDVLAHTDIDQVRVIQNWDALHEFVALGLRLADLMVTPEASSSIGVPVEVSDGVEVKYALLLRAALLDSRVNRLELRLNLPFNRALFPARVFQARAKLERVGHRLSDDGEYAFLEQLRCDLRVGTASHAGSRKVHRELVFAAAHVGPLEADGCRLH